MNEPPVSGPASGPFRLTRFLLPATASKNRFDEILDSQGRPVLLVERPAHFQPGCAVNCLGCLVALPVLVAAIVWAFRADDVLTGVLRILAGVLGLWGLQRVFVFLLAPARTIRFHGMDQGHPLLLSVQARHGKFRCLDPEGELLGRFSQSTGWGLRKEWSCRDASGRVVLLAREDSVQMSLLRRGLSLLLDRLGGFTLKAMRMALGNNLSLLPASFVLLDPEGRRILGKLGRGLTSFQSFVLDLGSLGSIGDPRLALALAVVIEIDERG